MKHTTVKSKAENYFISHPDHSFATFSIGERGDLFINSDWGFFTYAWRSFGNDFKDFLSGIDRGYFFKNIEANHFMQTKKKIGKRQAEAICVLFESLQETLKEEISTLKQK